MTRQHATWITLAQKQADHFGEKPAYIFLANGENIAETVTYKEVDRRARALAAHLQSSCNPGDRALLVYDSCIENIIAFFGCLYAGLIAVPVCPPHRNRRNGRLENILKDCNPSLALSTAAQIREIKRLFNHDSVLDRVASLLTETISQDETNAWIEPASNGKTLAFLQYTSGSTNTPKGVAVSHGNLLHNQAMLQHAFQTTEHSNIVSWLPIYHDMGLIGKMLHSFYAGATCVFMSPMSFLQQPARWLYAISKYKAEISGGPNFSYSLCEKKISADLLPSFDLSSWRVALNGAEPVQYHTLQGFSDRFAPCGFQEKAFYPGYGMAEATLIISGGSPGQEPVYRWVDKNELRQDRAVSRAPSVPSAQPLVGCGRQILDEIIVIVDPQTSRPLPDDQIGEIWLAGKHVAQGYWGRPEATRNTFHAYLIDGRGPFLRTGDLGFLKDGTLFITGRLKDVIILEGSKHYPQDIEASIQALIPAVRPEGVAAVSVTSPAGEKVVVVAELERELLRKADLKSVANSIRRVVSQDHGLVLQDVVLIRPGALPKTTSGKIQRRLCGDLYLSEELQVHHQAPNITAMAVAAN
ncbi:MAG TPA: fatty acyl-AMP ligase [Candidatus Angelobacter sp.]|jgi:acyl-CoA synthetase (AMP-forming)/AMP-acid ligase II|nr:fatty acyl-AMP ligase [Candidatus Angelobacter sp.]